MADEPGAEPAVLRDAAFRRWSAATILVRMPGFMAPLAFVLVGLATTHAARAGGLMVALKSSA